MKRSSSMSSVKGSDYVTNYEELMSEYDGHVTIEERKMKNDGLYCDNFIWINRDLTERQKACILAEEIGHYETTVGDITFRTDLNAEKQEQNARIWGYKKLLPPERILSAYSEGYTHPAEMAEYLDVDEIFLIEAINYYRRANIL